jgi:benzoate 4-monooxygenase
MIQAAKDSAAVAIDGQHAMDAYGKGTVRNYVEIPAVKILNDRGEFSATMGVLPPWLRPIIRKMPWFRKGSQAVKNLAGMAIVMVAKRLSTPTDRTDLLSKLQEGKDDEGNPMGREELTAEALTQLIAGSDTTSKYARFWQKCDNLNLILTVMLSSSCAITYYLASSPRVQAKLQKELDEHLGTEDETVSTSEQVKRLPYLEAVINESLRLHSTSSIGLPRLVPPGGLTVLGRHFPEGAVLSVPSYTIHRDPKIWGEDIDEFRPERWFELDQADIQKTFNPFSYGPR